ncbi:MAG: hypothetical protein E6J11_10120 [Chloroflexi bacterium]|nr:MAG: hypothetical protein E6J11_10120 [Chloroflexota bacterium]
MGLDGCPYAPTSAPPPKVDRKGHPYYTTDQPAKAVESSGVARGTLGSTLQLVRMGGPRAPTPRPNRSRPYGYEVASEASS